MKASKQTKKTKGKKIVLSIIHFLLVFGPLLFFVPYAFITGAIVTKITLGLASLVSIIIAAIGALSEAAHAGFHKSIMWIMIIALLTALTEVKLLIFIMAGASVLDELIFSPLLAKAKTQLITNKELDKRR